jgi:hypothetical protein
MSTFRKSSKGVALLGCQPVRSVLYACTCRDEFPTVTADLIVRHVVDRVRRKHDVVAVERRAVRPFHPAAQMPGDRFAVLAHAAVGLGRDTRRKLGDRLVVLAVPHEIRHGQLREVVQDERRREVRVERVEVLRVPDPQHVRLGVGVLVRASRRAVRAGPVVAALRAAGDGESGKDDPEYPPHPRHH